MRALLDGESVEVGAARPARLPHHRPVPIWIAAGGPRTLRMAGGVADGVFIRVGTHAGNLETSIDAIRAGAAEAGRDPAAVRLAAIFHTVFDGRCGARAADGQVDGRRLLRILADALRSPRAALDRARSRDAQARAARSGPTSTTPPTSNSAAAPSTSSPPKPPTPSACAAARRHRQTAPARHPHVALCARLRRASSDPRPAIPRRSEPTTTPPASPARSCRPSAKNSPASSRPTVLRPSLAAAVGAAWGGAVDPFPASHDRRPA